MVQNCSQHLLLLIKNSNLQWIKVEGNNVSLPVANPSVLNTLIVISVDDGLLRTSTGCAGPSSSSTLYVDWLNLIVGAVMKCVLIVLFSSQ